MPLLKIANGTNKQTFKRNIKNNNKITDIN